MADERKKKPREPIPVTLLSGFLGSGKTTLMQNILKKNQAQGEKQWRVAVIVNDMAELNIDAKLVGSVTQTEEKMVQMQNGCICCTLREDLLLELKKLAEEGKFDYILIESTGISEPQQVAETFAFEDADGVALNDWTKLDTLVTMVDAVNFMRIMETTDNVQDTKEAVGEDDVRSLSCLLIDQVEFANVLLLNKTDLVDEAQLVKIEGLLKQMNPKANVVRTQRSNVPLELVMNTGIFDIDEAAATPGWMQVMRGEPMKSEKEEYGVSSFIYKRRQPFHPERLYQLLDGNDPLPGVIRSKGFCWLAHHNDEMFSWASAGIMYDITPDFQPWFSAQAPDNWGEGLDYRSIFHDFVPPHGDRRQEIVIIGHGMDREAIEKILDGGLVKEGEDISDVKCPWNFAAAFQEQEEEDDEEEGEEDEEGEGEACPL
mmetsp:Transcript_36599/g.57440  ORF Transcript_36599/g.57440 Transcript_36599/m.57440 type:complete len:430 (-) Transcript_36599:189-1478(-)|eukprot:CAMPEP_0201506370 /NCGR_PEP_ID=MMETSP0161_2-20130828/281_1 /ASSEMBLY_ACC=CAM_ASM_000251 /TAXON_ID=180227 /ORGANISM="Neoparamoeba aestuarina, Strain SoJaBio B1-5/56/2" /LENGTH=429 /DNA_ID=CAMNT_0047900435 /DNA_START=128 /DNA_END=1417 /DNA_ORIENTATION=-